MLRLEIHLSIDSPAELARERLQLQVDVLRTSLKSGAATDTDSARLVALCALPALVDQSTTLRLQRIVECLATVQQ